VLAAATSAAGSLGIATGSGLLARPLLLAACLLLGAVCGGLVLLVDSRRAVGSDAAIAALRKLTASQDARLREMSDAQGRFVANIAHEIKTPLTIVLAELDLLLRTRHDAAAVEAHGRRIATDLRHVSDLVDSFLRLAHPFAQANTDHHARVHVNDFVLESIRRSQAVARTNRVSIVLNLSEPTAADSDPEVLGDTVLLEAMLENLVRNAVRFSSPEGKVLVTVDVDSTTIRIRVLDRGDGIAAEHRESVFDWFFRSPGVTLPSTGTGFGLAIAKRVAEHHGGTIDLQSAPGDGCRFEITLPRHRAAAALGEPVAAPPVA